MHSGFNREVTVNRESVKSVENKGFSVSSGCVSSASDDLERKTRCSKSMVKGFANLSLELLLNEGISSTKDKINQIVAIINALSSDFIPDKKHKLNQERLLYINSIMKSLSRSSQARNQIRTEESDDEESKLSIIKKAIQEYGAMGGSFTLNFFITFLLTDIAKRDSVIQFKILKSLSITYINFDELLVQYLPFVNIFVRNSNSIHKLILHIKGVEKEWNISMEDAEKKKRYSNFILNLSTSYWVLKKVKCHDWTCLPPDFFTFHCSFDLHVCYQ